ncbi:MAG: hypothetical protein PHZ05_02610, partial [Pygmaiobacter massiliensis]|nr:hypothetical protein [Pygmaiobacter massiliensis]
MKKLIVLTMALLLCLSMAACGNGSSRSSGGSESQQPTSSNVSSSTQAVTAAELPDTYVVSAYDDEYFKPQTDDFIVVSYDMPVVFRQPEWFRQYGGKWAFGLYHDDNAISSTVKVTYLLCFDGEKYLGTKLRLEYASIEEAMISSLAFDYNFVPAELGMADEKTDDEKLLAQFFEDSDKRAYGAIERTDYHVVYQGHFNEFRYFDFTPQESLGQLKQLEYMRLGDSAETFSSVPISSLNYSAGKTETCEISNYQMTVEATTYSSKRTNKAGSDNTVLEKINKLSSDAENFSPITDDFAYVIKTNSNS